MRTAIIIEAVRSSASRLAGRYLLLGVFTFVPFAPSYSQQARLVVQTGHSDFINTASFSFDGRFVATGSEDTTIKIWEVGTGREVRTLAAHSTKIRMVAFSPISYDLASADDGERIAMWNIETGLEKWSKPGGISIAFSPDGTILAGGVGGKLIVWNAATGDQITSAEHNAHSSVSTIAFSPDGSRIATGSYDGTIKIWKTLSYRQMSEIRVKGHSTMVAQVMFSRDGRSVFGITWDGVVHEWNAATGIESRRLARHKVHVNSIALDPKGRLLATASAPPPDQPSRLQPGADDTVKLWNARSGAAGVSLERDDNEIKTVLFSPDGSLLAGAGTKRSLTFWDVATGKVRRDVPAHAASVGSVAFSPDGKWIASGNGGSTQRVYGDRSIKIWPIASDGELRTFDSHSEYMDSIAFSGDSATVALGGREDNDNYRDFGVELWDVASGESRTVSSGKYGVIGRVAFSRDGKKIAGASFSDVYLWNVDDPVTPLTLEGHATSVGSIAFSPDSKFLASGSGDNSAKIWSAETGGLLNTLSAHSSRVTCLAFSPDSKTLATGSEISDGTIRLWDAANGAPRLTIPTHSWVHSLAFSPDGKILASAAGDRSVRFWDPLNGTALKVLGGHNSSVSSISFDPTGKFLASGSADGTIKIWNTSSGDELCTLIAFDKDDWVVTAPDGRFDTNKNLDRIDGLHWILSDNPLTPKPLELFMRQYYEPNLLQRILKCNRERTANGPDPCAKEFKPLPPIGQINRVQPQVAKPRVSTPNEK